MLGLSPNTEYVVYVSAANGVSELAMEDPNLIAATDSKSSTVGAKCGLERIRLFAQKTCMPVAKENSKQESHWNHF